MKMKMKMKTLHKKAYSEPELEFVMMDSEVTLYTSTAGDSGEVFGAFDSNWLN